MQRKAKGEAKGSSKKKAKKGGAAAEEGVIDQAEMMRQWQRMTEEDRAEFLKATKSGNV